MVQLRNAIATATHTKTDTKTELSEKGAFVKSV